ncbi:MAG: ATP-dependent Clp protease adapter ClpS [Synechococcaceae bacterium WB9_2_112]|nr:ATP-dependent Clp protease adapter ClpS [Synechococcaceae bacterium WB9_2_112]
MRTTLMSRASTTPLRERSTAVVRERHPYPHFKVVVLDDDVNTFVHVVECLVRFIPAMTPDRAWELAHQIDGQGSAVVWAGPQEQAELYHQQLGGQGLTMAPLEPA